jgi:hypothetical protein
MNCCRQFLTIEVDALINSVTWLYGAEVVPHMIRSKMGRFVRGLPLRCRYCSYVTDTQYIPPAITALLITDYSYASRPKRLH